MLIALPPASVCPAENDVTSPWQRSVQFRQTRTIESWEQYKQDVYTCQALVDRGGGSDEAAYSVVPNALSVYCALYEIDKWRESKMVQH